MKRYNVYCMEYKEDITGRTFNLLTVLRYSHIKKGHGSYWLCQCECGNKTTVRIDGLKSGHPKSCGCLSDKWRATGNANRTHGKTKTRIYQQWRGMKGRCFNENNQDYKHYGGRGITVCNRWLKFENFFEDMGECPKDYTIERINNDGKYEPSNCKWIHNKRQNRNKRNSFMIKYKGKNQCLAAWAEHFKINYYTLHKRLRYSGKAHVDIFKELEK